jgi:hypothetical protein
MILVLTNEKKDTGQKDTIFLKLFSACKQSAQIISLTAY